MNSGIVSLGDFSITSAATVIGDWVDGLEGMRSASVQVRLAYGSGGGAAKVYLQTSLDQGLTIIDVASFTFGAAGSIKVRNLFGDVSVPTDVVPTDGGLADDTTIAGILGDRLRLKIVSTGSYSSSTLISGRACVR